jgi:hypothetical protein
MNNIDPLRGIGQTRIVTHPMSVVDALPSAPPCTVVIFGAAGDLTRRKNAARGSPAYRTDAGLEALRRYTARIVEARGWVNETDVLTFLQAGYSRANVLAVIVGVGLKTLSNYTNHIVGTELDAAFAGRAW